MKSNSLPKHIAVRRFVRQVLIAVDEGRTHGFSTGEVGYVLHDIALGILASELTQVELMTFLASAAKGVGRDLSDVCSVVARGSADARASSVLRMLGFGDSHHRFVEAAYAEFRDLSKNGDTV